jgi:hypothetical protein
MQHAVDRVEQQFIGQTGPDAYRGAAGEWNANDDFT